MLGLDLTYLDVTLCSCMRRGTGLLNLTAVDDKDTVVGYLSL